MAKDKTSKKDKGAKPAGTGKAAESTSKKAGKGSHNLAGPGTGGQFKADENVGKLLLITPHSVEEGIVTSNGEANATRADIVVLDEKGKGKHNEISDALIFQKVVQGQLRDAINNKSRVVGRLIVDDSRKKKGQNAPYALQAPTEGDIKVATDYLDSLDPLR